MTLPSRLRPYHDFEASLAGDDGRHTIFELQSSIISQDSNDKLPPTEDNGRPKAETEFDIDFTYGEQSNGNAHIFNQVQVTRGNERGKSTESTEDGRLRKLRLYNSEAMLQRYVYELLIIVSLRLLKWQIMQLSYVTSVTYS